MLTELLHSQVTLLLAEVTVQRFGIIAVFDQFVGYLLCLHLRPTEDDGEDARIVVYQSLQGQILILRIHHIIDMVHVFGTLVTRAHHDFLVVVQVTFGDTLYLTTHRC